MIESAFEGQQSGERILYEIHPHVFSKYLAISRIIALSVLFYAVLVMLASVAPQISAPLMSVGIILSMLLAAAGIWWNTTVYQKSKSFITDRRIIRFDVVSPFFITKRALFWNEALKAKGYAPHLFYRFLNIGTLVVEPQTADHENVRITDVYYFEDLANYIDKILFTFKNKPAEIENLRPFVPKPRGQRE